MHPTLPHILVSVLEDHTNSSPLNVVNTLAIINTQKHTVRTFASGFDFYASPRFNPEGTRIAWVQWNHPMPWDCSEIRTAECKILKDSSGEEYIEPKGERVIGAGPNESAIYPKWLDDHRLLFNSDKSGYQNPYILDTSSINEDPKPLFEHPIEQDFSEPMWVLGESFAAVVSPEHIIFATMRSGRSVLYEAKPSSKTRGDDSASHFWSAKEIESPFVHITSLRATGKSSALFIGEQPNAAPTLVSFIVMDGDSIQINDFSSPPIRATPERDAIDKSYFSAPQAFSFANAAGEPVHAVFYPPTNPEYAGPDSENEKCPCIINIHGGPTGTASQGLKMKVQYFTSRGVAWCDLNYGGSSGFGRRYMYVYGPVPPAFFLNALI